MTDMRTAMESLRTHVLRPWRLFWIAQAAFWTWSLFRSISDVRAGIADTYHNQHSRSLALDASGLLIALACLVLDGPRPKRKLWAVLMTGVVVALIASSRLA